MMMTTMMRIDKECIYMHLQLGYPRKYLHQNKGQMNDAAQDGLPQNELSDNGRDPVKASNA